MAPRGLPARRRQAHGAKLPSAAWLRVLCSLWVLLLVPALIADEPPGVPLPAPGPAPAGDGLGKPVEAAQLAFLTRKYDEARRLYQEGQYQGAFRIADSILVLAPEVPFRAELRRLRRMAEGRFLGLSVIEVRFDRTPGDVFPVQRLLGEVVLENLTDQPLGIGRQGRQEMLGQARVRITEVYADASQWSYERTRAVSIDGGFELLPGATRKIPLEIDLTEGGRAPIVQRLEVRGTFRPSELRLPDRRLDRTIPWLDSNELLVMRELGEIRAQPFQHLQLGLLSRDASRLVAATMLLVEEDREEEPWRRRSIQIAGMFIDALEPEPAAGAGANALLYRLLELVTGARLAPHAETWRLWLKTWSG